jgi:hypothetical protein
MVGELAEAGDRSCSCAQILDFRYREVRICGAKPRRALPDINEPIFFTVDERFEKHATNDTEDRRVGSDTERQGHNHRHGQTFDPSERSQRKAEIRQEFHGVPCLAPVSFSWSFAWKST